MNLYHIFEGTIDKVVKNGGPVVGSDFCCYAADTYNTILSIDDAMLLCSVYAVYVRCDNAYDRCDAMMKLKKEI